MEVTGQLKLKYDIQKVSEKFQKRDFVLSTDLSTPYPQHVSFQVTQDKCSMLDSFNEGDEIKVQFNLRGREWNGPQGLKYFNTLEAWKIEKVASSEIKESNTPISTDRVFPVTPIDNDDLPF